MKSKSQIDFEMFFNKLEQDMVKKVKHKILTQEFYLDRWIVMYFRNLYDYLDECNLHSCIGFCKLARFLKNEKFLGTNIASDEEFDY